MHFFHLGFLAALALAFGATGIWRWTMGEAIHLPELRHVADFGLAFGASCLAVELVQRLGPRRLFDPRVHAERAVFLRGVASACLSLVLIVLLFVVVPRVLPDWLVTSVSALTASAVLSLTTSRVRRGTCVVCAYPEQPGSVICCECGHAHTT